MYLIATGTFTDTQKVGPLIADEIRKINELRDEGIVVNAYRRVDMSGAVLLLKISSLEEARNRLGQLPLAKAGLMTVEFTQVEPF